MTAKKTTPSKRQLQRQERADALAAAILAAKAALKPPSTLSACGVTKTRCWVALHDKLSRQIRRRRPDTQRIQGLVGDMQRWTDFDADQASACLQRLTTPEPRKPKIEVAPGVTAAQLRGAQPWSQ